MVTTDNLFLPYNPIKCLALLAQETLTEKEKFLCYLVINIIDLCSKSGSIPPIPPPVFMAMEGYFGSFRIYLREPLSLSVRLSWGYLGDGRSMNIVQ